MSRGLGAALLASAAVALWGSAAAATTAPTTTPTTTTTAPAVTPGVAYPGAGRSALPPILVVSKTFSLDPGEQVTVTGSGFTPGAPVTLTECGAAAQFVDAPAECDSARTVSAVADRLGGFTATFTILISGTPTPFTAPDTALACPPRIYVPPGCVLVGSNTDDATQRMAVPISLNGVIPPRPTPPTTTPVLSPPVTNAVVVRTSPATLPETGSRRSTLVLVAIAIGLLDIGGHAVAAARRPKGTRTRLPTTAGHLSGRRAR